MKGQLKMKLSKIATLILTIVFAMKSSWAEPSIKLHGYGWVQTGMIMHMTDTLNNNYSKNWMQSAATQITASILLSDYLEGFLGIGGGQEHFMQGKSASAREVQVRFSPYITQASFRYFLGDRDNPDYFVTVGHFPYIYNADVKNLGMYLLRGPVYPGALVSGFESKETLPIANFLGTQAHAKTGNFTHDLLITSEIENKPYYDFSFAYIFKHKATEFFNYGAGINLYHWLPVYDRFTNPRNPSLYNNFEPTEEVKHPLDRGYFYVDTANHDTTWYTHKGEKLTAFYSLDIKKLANIQGMGENDLILYGEVGLIGIRNYKGIYEKRLDRMPIMVGFNLPAFGWLDNLSLEVEYYSSPYKNDIYKLQTQFSPIPVANSDYLYEPKMYLPGDTLNGVALTDTVQTVVFNNKEYTNLRWGDPYDQTNLHRDDWKWSLHMAKTVMKHIRFSAQVANDHFRPIGIDSEFGVVRTYYTAFSTPKDWYYMSKVTYFF